MSNNNNNEIKITDKDIEYIGEKISETLIENGKDSFADAIKEKGGSELKDLGIEKL